MEKLQAKGELGEEELRALEEDVTGEVRRVFVDAELYADICLDHACVVARDSVRGFTSPPRSETCVALLSRLSLTILVPNRLSTACSRSQASQTRCFTTEQRFVAAQLSNLRASPYSPVCIQGLLLIGAVFKSTVPDETDEERRELERYVTFP